MSDDDIAPIADIEVVDLEMPSDLSQEALIAPSLVLENLGKAYQGIPALQNFTYRPQKGGIHAILGDHQAGKSTLLNLLAGFATPDTGVIRWFGRPVRLATAADALALGIGMVHQHPTFVPNLSVGENILLGTADDGFPPFRRGPYRKIRNLAQQYQLMVQPSASVNSLSSTDALHAELLRLLYRDLTFLLLDDPFARLHPHYHKAFCDTLRQLANEGKTVFLTTTSPKLALQSADTIVVLQQGEMIRTVAASESNAAALYHTMTGHPKPPVVEHSPATLGAVILSTRQLAAPPTLQQATLDIRRGELLAVVGLPDNGQEALADILVGVRSFTSGKLFIGSEEVFQPNEEEARRLGVAYLPPPTHLHTLAEEMTVAENLALRSYQQLARGGMLWGNALNSHAESILTRYQIQSAPQTPVRDLTPTEKHQLLLARTTAQEYQLLVALYPTLGLALENALTVRRHMLAERARGKAILLLTDDPQEAQTLGDRIAVLRQGRIVAMFDPPVSKIDTLEIQLLMEGTDSDTRP